MAYSHYAQITVDKTKVGETDANFAVLFSGIYDGTGGEPDLRTTGNGGHVQNTASGGASGSYTVPADLVFSPNADGSSKHDFEIEKYDASTGEIVAWVQCGVSTVANTVFYVVYGDVEVTTSQENVTGTWDSNFVGVWHLAEASNSTVYDSAGNNDSSAQSFDSATAKIGAGANFTPADNDLITIPDSASLDITSMTLAVWLKLDSWEAEDLLFRRDDTEANRIWSLQLNGSDELIFVAAAPTTWTLNVSTTGANLGTGTWYYIVCVSHSGTGGYVYVNAVQRGSDEVDVGDIRSGAVGITIGATAGHALELDGILDEIRMSSVARSADYVTTTHNNQSSPSTFYSVGSESTTSTSTSSTTSTSSSTSTSTSTTSTSTSTTTTIGPAGIAWGEQTPTGGEAAVSWQVWSDGAGGDPEITGDPNWGKVKLEGLEIGHSSVIDTATAQNKGFTVTIDEYGTGSGSGTVYVRGQAANFDQDDLVPTWQEYVESFVEGWRFVQVKLVGPGG